MICLGRETSIVLADKREIDPPKSHGLLFDPSGKHWPRCSLLICGFEKGHAETEPPGDLARDYFGADAPVYKGSVALPPRDLHMWGALGEIDALYYDRTGTAHRGYFRHRFYKPRGLYRLLFIAKGADRDKGPVTLYRHKRKRAWRIEMPAGCIVDDRGIVMP